MVARRFETLGRRTGALLCCNIAGNVAGALLVGFVLLDRLGTSGTLRLLAGVLVLAGVAAAGLSRHRRRRMALAVGAVALLATELALFPSNASLWAPLAGVATDRFALAEDRACVSSLVERDGRRLLLVNGASQNAYPYDDFHVLIGLAPTLMHPHPGRALAVGLGVGATTYGMAQDGRLRRVETVKLCGGQVELLRLLAREGSPESGRLLADDRVVLEVGDGRRHLLAGDRSFDVVTVDTLRPQAAYSGNLYSVEFYELVRRRLAPDGLFSQWVATPRSLESARQVFPHIAVFPVPAYGSAFLVASPRPIDYDRHLVLGRLAAEVDALAFSPAQAAALEAFFSGAQPAPARQGEPAPVVGADALNRDLFPRDEYFINNR